MPLIGYKCECGHTDTRLVSSKEAGLLLPREKCPKCGGDTLRRQLGRTNSTSKITIDQPGMAKAVEIVPEVIDSKYGKNQS